MATRVIDGEHVRYEDGQSVEMWIRDISHRDMIAHLLIGLVVKVRPRMSARLWVNWINSLMARRRDATVLVDGIRVWGPHPKDLVGKDGYRIFRLTVR